MYIAMEDRWLLRVGRLIRKRTGLNLFYRDGSKLLKVISSRIRRHDLADSEAYFRFLKSDGIGSAAEWRELIHQVTTGESYFFRDQGQVALLKSVLLPELIERHRQERLLRLWSAGCSSGEEPYSLAMLLEELLPPAEGWRIFILATDIDEISLERARRGDFRDWSLRMLSPDRRRRYFRQGNKGWELDERIRSRVTFRHGNLVSDPFPDARTDIHDMDLILCRNVFIYLDPRAVSQVLPKLAMTLSDGGYLMTGHVELHGQELAGLRTMVFPESVVYQRTEHGRSHRRQLPTPQHRTSLPSRGHHTPPLPVSPEPKNGANVAHHANSKSKLTAPAEAQSTRSSIITAREFADAGDYDKANEGCLQVLQDDPLATAPHYLMAQIAEARGELEKAMSLLKRVIYLCPSFVPAYLDLAGLYERNDAMVKANTTRAAALELLRTMPPQAVIEPYEGMTVAELTRHVEQMLEGVVSPPKT